MRPDRAQILNNAPLEDLILIILKQYRRLLAERGIELTEANLKVLSADIAAQKPADAQAAAIRETLITLVNESERVLAHWNLTFAQSLQTEMADVPGWETTAEFLEIANEKSNAELRISSASALAAALGDLRFAPYLLHMIAHDPDEMDAVVARRVLLLLSGVEEHARDWLAQVQRWLEQKTDRRLS